MGSQRKWLVIFIFNYLIYSYLVGRANLLIKSLNACTEQQTNATLNARLPSAFEDLNVPVWLLIGSGFTAVSGSRQRSKKMPVQRVTQTCGTTFLHQKQTLRISSAPSAITEATLLSMYVFLASNSCKSQLIEFLIFEEIFTEASRPFIRTTNGP